MKVKNLIIFLSGVATGVVGAYLYLKKKTDERIEKEVTEKLNKEIADYRKTYARKTEELYEMVMKKNEELNEEKPERPANEKSILELQIESDKAWGAYYNKLHDYGYLPKSYEGKNENEDEEDYGDVEFLEKPKEKRPPYIVDDYTHWNTKVAYDHIGVVWDPEECKLYDDDGDQLLEVETLIGLENIEQLMKPGVTEIFVRNEEEATDYEVTLVMR